MSFDDEDGDLRDKEDIAFRQEAMEEKNHVTWNGETLLLECGGG